MDRASQQIAVTGEAMDRVITRQHGRKYIKAAAVLSIVVLAGAMLWWAMPAGLEVRTNGVQIATVEKGVFEDKIIVRANAVPLRSVILDSVESGRVEEVAVQDGAVVQAGKLLFKLSNSQRNIELLARQAELAQQISNLSNLKVAEQASRSDHVRRLAELKYALEQASKKNSRDIALSRQGFFSAAALEESKDGLLQRQRDLEDEQTSARTDAQVRNDAIKQMEGAIKGLESGLVLVKKAVEALAVRAPSAGRLTGFNLQVGETVRTGDRVGRIDEPSLFKLAAQVDEFYLGRATVGRDGVVRLGVQAFPVKVSNVFPQIKDGKFSIEFTFANKQPEQLSPGQSGDIQLVLGEPSPAVYLPNGNFLNDSGGAWVFVVSGDQAERKSIRVGRRNAGQVEILEGLSPGEKVIISSYATYVKSQRLTLVRE
jgi:HlyD family secretion protein